MGCYGMVLIIVGRYGVFCTICNIIKIWFFYAMALLHSLFKYNVCKSFPVAALIIMGCVYWRLRRIAASQRELVLVFFDSGEV